MSYLPFPDGRHCAAENTPCDHCASIPKERVRLVDIVDEVTWATIVSVRLCRACRKEVGAQLHDFSRGWEGQIPGIGRRKRSASDNKKFVARGRRVA